MLNELVGKKITVYSKGDTERQDVGVLVAFDSQFIKLKKTDSETVFFNLALVRAVKPFDLH